jgi:hypothetical protein
MLQSNFRWSETPCLKAGACIWTPPQLSTSSEQQLFQHLILIISLYETVTQEDLYSQHVLRACQKSLSDTLSIGLRGQLTLIASLIPINTGGHRQPVHVLTVHQSLLFPKVWTLPYNEICVKNTHRVPLTWLKSTTIT